MRQLALLLFSFGVSHAETFPAANGLERSLVASEPLFKNPISVSVDVDGTLYVTETLRRKIADLDIRKYYKHNWVPADVSHTSVEDKLNFFRKTLDGSNKLVADLNGDGIHNHEDLTAVSEKIHQLRDTDGDGIMDKSSVFAEGFHTEVTGVAAGVLAWRGDVYATIAPDLWKLRDKNNDGQADSRESIAHGFGIHIAYGGHDMHGLTLGPDGRIYWTIGDKGVNVTSKEGKKFFAPHEGAVLSCNPDGSDFEIFARGLRNPQEIAFDQYGNIFSVDNDSDQKGERERFVHIVEESDTGWRNYYQYRNSKYNPWMAESIWEPSGENQPAYITPPIANYSDGPSGFAYNPGTALSEKYQGAFFVTEFPKGNLRSFKVKPKGASFEMTDEHIVLSGVMNVGINFGPDGALYSADWSGGYPMNKKGAIWKLDDPKNTASKQRKQVQTMLSRGAQKAPLENLVERLHHPDMRIRLDAQWELVRRKDVSTFEKVALSAEATQLAKIHSLWGLSQMQHFSETAFNTLSKSPDPALRAQAARHAGEASAHGHPELITLLKDENLRVRFEAAMAIWKSEMPDTLPAIIDLLTQNNNADTNIRHAGVLALTLFSPQEILKTARKNESRAVRLAAAVALRRSHSPLVAELLEDRDPQVVAEAARAIHDDPAIPEVFPLLAQLLGKKPEATTPAIKRSIAANRHIANTESAKRLIAFSINTQASEPLRVAALEALATWGTSITTDLVDGRHHLYPAADLTITKIAFKNAQAELRSESSEAIALAVSLVEAAFGIAADEATLLKDATDIKLDLAPRLRAIRTLSRKSPKTFQTTAKKLLKNPSVEIRIATANALYSSDPNTAVNYAKNVLETSESIREKQNAIKLAGKDTRGRGILKKIVSLALKNPTQKSAAYEPAILLELLKVISKEDKTRLNEKLDEVAPLKFHFSSLHGGNSKKGSQVFNEHLASQCTACHRVEAAGSEVGPPLTEVGKKGREYILESLINPQAKLTPGYGMIAIQTKSGQSIMGAFMSENQNNITISLPDKTQQIVKKSQIATQTTPISTMPPMHGILSPTELRDLVAYLEELQ